MKTYEVELRYWSYSVITVQAETPEQAEERAWEQLESEGESTHGNWEIESIEEMEELK